MTEGVYVSDFFFYMFLNDFAFFKCNFAILSFLKEEAIFCVSVVWYANSGVVFTTLVGCFFVYVEYSGFSYVISFSVVC